MFGLIALAEEVCMETPQIQAFFIQLRKQSIPSAFPADCPKSTTVPLKLLPT